MPVDDRIRKPDCFPLGIGKSMIRRRTGASSQESGNMKPPAARGWMSYLEKPDHFGDSAKSLLGPWAFGRIAVADLSLFETTTTL